MRPDIIPIVIGVSLCSASALLLYIWYKTKDRDDEVDSPVHPVSKSTKTKRVECVISNNIVPLVVGRGGANIKSIEGKTNTQIRFKAKDDSNQICEISGEIEDVDKAVELINVQASPPPNLTEEMYVPQTAYGKIVGRCGEALQEICRKSQAKVYIDAGDRTDGETRRLCIKGTRAHVNIAKGLIEEKIRIDEESRKNVDVKREPRGNVKPVVETAPAPAAATTTTGTTEVVPPKLEKLPTNIIEGQLEVYVSAVATPSRFWIQLYGKQSSDLDKLTVSMTDYYDKENNQKLHKIADPYLGQIVAAMFKYDSKWYRAEIVGILPNEYNPRNVILDLYFVDFGDSEYVQPNEVFELRTDFLTLRFQAIECFLANVKPKNDEELWDQEAISKFEDLTHVARWKKMNARVVTTKERKYGDGMKREGSPIPGVQLFNPEIPDVNIADKLISEGLADGITSSEGNHRSGEILRLDGGDDRSDSKGIKYTKKTGNNQYNGSDKLAATSDIKINGNNENVKDKSLKNSSSSFIDNEKQNGNKVTRENNTETIDRNSNRSYTVT